MPNLFEINSLVLGAIPVTLGIVAALRTAAPSFNSRYAPLASLVVGIGLVALTGIAWQQIVIQGILVGLSASGLWSGAKALFSPVQPSEQ